jgi:mRNA-degrading endonuclease YafQ of YafQ-DinJ toxin-antitoxin module
VSYRYRAAETFWDSFYALSPSQKESVRRAWQIFKDNPFDARLRPHKIHSLSARYKKTIYSAVIEGDLRVVFYIAGNTVWSVDIGTHALYR